MDLANEKSWIWWGFTLCEMLASGKSRIMSHLSEAPGDLPAGLCGFLHLFLPLSGCGLWLLQWLSTWSLRCQMSAVYCGKPKAINLYKPSFFGGMPYVKCLPLISGHGNKDYADSPWYFSPSSAMAQSHWQHQETPPQHQLQSRHGPGVQ